MLKLNKQQKRVLEYMIKNKTITSLEAVQKLGVYRLSARILELKEKGFDIDGIFIEVRNRFGELCNVKQYFIRGRNEILNNRQ
jgi:hypothetical protein